MRDTPVLRFTGKSYLVKHIIDAFANIYGMDPSSDIACVAYTGSAATNLAKSGNPNCTTIHKLIYFSSLGKDGKYHYKLRPFTKVPPYKVLIVDEYSMLNEWLLDGLLRYPWFIIFCGDVQQLSPIEGIQPLEKLGQPHVFLDQVMRQALESDIIRLSMDIREGKPLTRYIGKDARVLEKEEFTSNMLPWADATICALNKTRNNLNTIARQQIGRIEPIEEGELLVCLTNNWDVFSNDGVALTNGIRGELHNWHEETVHIDAIPKKMKAKDVPVIIGDIITKEGSVFERVVMDKQCITTGKPTLTSQQKYNIIKILDREDLIPNEFTYGSCITCWKAQGATIEKTLAIEEWFPTDVEEHKKYLYTAVTRAADKLILIKDDSSDIEDTFYMGDV